MELANRSHATSLVPRQVWQGSGALVATLMHCCGSTLMHCGSQASVPSRLTLQSIIPRKYASMLEWRVKSSHRHDAAMLSRAFKRHARTHARTHTGERLAPLRRRPW